MPLPHASAIGPQPATLVLCAGAAPSASLTTPQAGAPVAPVASPRYGKTAALQAEIDRTRAAGQRVAVVTVGRRPCHCGSATVVSTNAPAALRCAGCGSAVQVV